MRLNNHGNTSRDYERAHRLRRMASPIEQNLWRKLRVNAEARGLKFRRQQAIHPYIADFACMKARLLIELDGATHDATAGYDKARDENLCARGFCILRFTNQEVTQNSDGVIETILTQAEKRIQNFELCAGGAPPTPNPAPQGGREQRRAHFNLNSPHRDGLS